jgi:hypothetical protein
MSQDNFQGALQFGHNRIAALSSISDVPEDGRVSLTTALGNRRTAASLEALADKV